MTAIADTDADFLRAILAAPDDDAPRLIYADWLDENGKPERAEFIRVQCQLARWDCTFKQTKEQPGWKHNCGTDENGYWLCQPLRSREADLLQQHGEAWAMAELVRPLGFNITICGIEGHQVRERRDGGLARAITWHWSRGFIEQVELDCATLLGRECERCEGRGFDLSPCDVCGNTPNESGTIDHGRGCYVASEDGGGSEVADDCHGCHGSGRVGGCAAALARAVPVKAVVLTDYSQYLIENGLRWTWSLQLRTMLEMPLMVYDSEPAACEAAWKAAAAFVRRGGRT